MTMIEIPLPRVGDTGTGAASATSMPRRRHTDRDSRRAFASNPSPTRTSSPSTSTVSLPRRFDVHEIDAVVTAVRSASSELIVLDGSSVEMIDLAAVETLARLATEADLTFASTSVALLATLQFTGHDDLLGTRIDAHQHDAHQYDEAA